MCFDTPRLSKDIFRVVLFRYLAAVIIAGEVVDSTMNEDKTKKSESAYISRESLNPDNVML